MNETEMFDRLFSSLKDDMQNGFKIITASIGELKRDIDEHIRTSIQDSGDVKVLLNNQNKFEKDLQNNFDQHKEFYEKFTVIDKLPNIENIAKKTETNENDIIEIKSAARTTKIIFGIIIAIITVLIKVL